MAPFAPVLDHAQASAIRDYVIRRANDDARRARRKTGASAGCKVMARSSWRKARRAALRPARNVMPFPAVRMAVAHFRGLPVSRHSTFPGSCDTSARACERTPSCRRSPARCRRTISTTWPPTMQASKLRSRRWRAADPDLVKRGEQLAEAGNAAKGLPGCNVCHGAAGAGSRRPSHILPDNMRATPRSSCACGSAASAETVPRRWRCSRRNSMTRRSRRSPRTTSRLGRPRLRRRRPDVD